MKYIYLLLLSLLSCTKQEQPESVKPSPVLIQIEAVYIDGNTDLSPMVLVR